MENSPPSSQETIVATAWQLLFPEFDPNQSIASQVVGAIRDLQPLLENMNGYLTGIPAIRLSSDETRFMVGIEFILPVSGLYELELYKEQMTHGEFRIYCLKQMHDIPGEDTFHSLEILDALTDCVLQRVQDYETESQVEIALSYQGFVDLEQKGAIEALAMKIEIQHHQLSMTWPVLKAAFGKNQEMPEQDVDELINSLIDCRIDQPGDVTVSDGEQMEM